MPDPQLSIVKTEPIPTITESAPLEGYWEDRGIAGQMWHPPLVPLGRDPASQRGDTAVIGGLPVVGDVTPEMVVGGYGAGRAVVGAMRGTAGTTSRAVAGMRALVTNAAPAVKYEITKSFLESLGVPTSVAAVIAAGASGVPLGRRGAVPAGEPPPPPTPGPSASAPPPGMGPTIPGGRPMPPMPPTGPTLPGMGRPPGQAPLSAPPATPPPLSPAASVPPVSAPPGPPRSAAPPPMSPAAEAPAVSTGPRPPLAFPTAPTAPAGPRVALSPPGWSVQRIRNEVGLAARRAKVNLTDEQLAQADELVHAGHTPEAAVTAVAPPPKGKVSAAEMGEYGKLRRRGLSHQKAVELLETQRELAAQLGTPTAEELRQAIADRTRTGRWPE